MSIVDRIQGLSGGLAIKAPCRTTTTANIPWLNGLSAVGGVALAAGDRVLVKDQADPVENGIYVADTGDWTRAIDFDGPNDAVLGTWVMVAEGTSAGYVYRAVPASVPVLPGATSITFENTVLGGVFDDAVTSSVLGWTSQKLVDTFSALGHGHVISDVAGLMTALGGIDTELLALGGRIDTKLDLDGPADRVAYDNTAFGLAATNVQDALDELVASDAYLLYQEQRTSGTNGPTYTSGAWRTVPLNTEVADIANLGVLSSNQVTLQPGTYRVQATTSVRAPSSPNLNLRARVRNVTDGTTLAEGMTEIVVLNDSSVTPLFGRFTLAAAKAIELQVYPGSNTVVVPGLSTGEPEIYAALQLIRE